MSLIDWLNGQAAKATAALPDLPDDACPDCGHADATDPATFDCACEDRHCACYEERIKG
jgi:hypothetical protein